MIEDLKGSAVLRARSHMRRQTLHGFQIMIKNVRARCQDDIQRVLVPVKIRSQDFDDPLRKVTMQFANAFGEDRCATVRQIIACDRRDNDMTQVQCRGGARQALGFPGINAFRLPRFHRTKSTMARADIAEDHERQAAARKTFPAIGALAAHADRIQPFFS